MNDPHTPKTMKQTPNMEVYVAVYPNLSVTGPTIAPRVE